MALIRREATQYQSGTDLQQKIGTPILPGAFISAGHGSRGLLSAPLGGELIARMIAGESLDELTAVAEVLDPRRVVWKVLRSQ